MTCLSAILTESSYYGPHVSKGEHNESPKSLINFEEIEEKVQLQLIKRHRLVLWRGRKSNSADSGGGTS